MGCDLGCEGAVAAAEVYFVVGGLVSEHVYIFGGSGGDDGGGCGVGFLGPVVFVGGWRVHVLKWGSDITVRLMVRAVWWVWV